MSRVPEPADENAWQPATSKPGEVFTYEGQIRSVGAFARGAVNHDARLRPYRRSMWLTGLAVIAIGLAATAVILVLGALAG